MRRTFIGVVTLLLNAAAAVAQTASPDSQVTQALLAEVRQLRQDLYMTAATIQRVQIAVYRHQAQSAALSRSTERLEQAHGACNRARQEHKFQEIQIERAETRRRNAKDASEKDAAENDLIQLKPIVEQAASQEQECQGEQVEAEAQFRLEEAKMNELQEQLDKLDRFLARSGGR